MPCSCCNGCGRCVTARSPFDSAPTVNHDYRTREECEQCACLQQVEIDGVPQCPDYQNFYHPCPEGTLVVSQPSPSLEIYNAPCFGTGPYGAYPWTAGATAECGVIVSVGEAIGGIFYPVFARLGRVAPTVTAAFSPFSTASGASLSVTLEVTQDECGFDYWRLAAVDVASPGSGYSNGQSVFFHAAEGDTVLWSASASVAVGNGGVVGVIIHDRGAYYRESASAAPYVATPTVKVINSGAGSGADFQVNIDTDPTSESFGRISSVTVLDGGIGYGDICAQAIPASNCAECGEAPCSNGCPCGTWVFDSNQEPCQCCKWELGEGQYGTATCPAPDSTQEQIDAAIAACQAEGDAIRERLNQLRDDFEAAGWTVQYDDNWDDWVSEMPEGCYYCWGFKFSAKCEECERAYPRILSNWPSSYYHVHGPCDPDQWVMIPYERFSLGGEYAPTPGPIGCRNEDGTWRELGDQWDYSADVWSERGGALENYGVGYSYGNVWIPKCGQRITECVCCTNYELEWWDPLRRVTRDCWGECPPGYTAEGPGACDDPGNPFP